jgi:signal transduction histidine kinase
MRIKCEEQGVTIAFSEEKPVYVWADEFQIEQVITNYLSNALHHVDKTKKIKVKILSKDGILRVSVFNSGENIPQDELENIWEKFYKVDKARTRAYGGNGIGLSIVKAIMERHEKNYGVENKPDGVEFWFELDAQA